jgi:hypothetical protein
MPEYTVVCIPRSMTRQVTTLWKHSRRCNPPRVEVHYYGLQTVHQVPRRVYVAHSPRIERCNLVVRAAYHEETLPTVYEGSLQERLHEVPLRDGVATPDLL